MYPAFPRYFDQAAKAHSQDLKDDRTGNSQSPPAAAARECIHVWFVDRHPKVAEVSQALYNIGDVAYEVMNVGLVRKAATVGKPQGVSKVMQRHDRLYVARM